MTTPHNPDAERALLSAAIQWPDEIEGAALSPLAKSLFFEPRNATVWRHVLAMRQAREPIDLVTLSERLRTAGDIERIGGDSRLAELATDLPSPALVGQYLDRLEETARLRAIIRSTMEATQAAYRGESAADIIRSLDTETRFVMDQTSRDTAKHLREVLNGCIETVQEQMSAEETEKGGIKTGFKGIDEMTGGAHPGQLWVVGARPGNGKTAFAGNLAAQWGRDGIPTAIFSAEMMASEIGFRLLAAEARLDGMKMANGFLGRHDLPAMMGAIKRMTPWPVMVDDRAGMRLVDIEIGCRRMTRDFGLKIAIVDYLQLIREEAGSRSREDAVRRLSGGLKEIAKDLGITVVALAQLNREADGEPKLKHLRDSGSIEQDANVVLLLSLTPPQGSDVPTQDAKVIIAKCRGGKTGDVEGLFYRAQTQFELK